MDYLEIINSAKAKQQAVLDAAKEGKRALTAEEIENFDALQAEVENAKAMLDREQKLAATNALELTPVNAGQAPSNVRVGDTRDKLWGEGPHNGLGEKLIAVRNHFTGNGTDERLFKNAATGANTQVDSEGGFLVESEMMTGIMKKTYEYSQVASRCQRSQVGANSNGVIFNVLNEDSRATGSRFGGIQGYWIGEAGTITASQPELKQKEIKLNKLAGLCYATEELLQDGTALVSSIQEDFPNEFAWLLDDAILNGSGAGKPRGIANGGSVVTVAKETGQAADTIVYENVLKMWSRMWARSRMNAVWYINQDCEPELATMAQVIGTSGVPVYLPANGVSGMPYNTLFGRPVIPIEQAKTVGDKGDILLVDPSQYRIIEKGGIRADSSIHVKFLSDQMAYRFIYRVGGDPIWDSAITPANSSNTLSPYVNLAARA
jgi:HK97 family phage major capsid protein